MTKRRMRYILLLRKVCQMIKLIKKFWENLQKQLIEVKKFDEIKFPEYELAWNEWKSQLEYIEKDEDKLSFLRCLEIETSQVGLTEIEEVLLKRLQCVFNAKIDVAKT